MDAYDQKLLNILQEDFPLSTSPYQDIAVKMGISEQEVCLRINNLKHTGIIRRIGGVLNSRALGYYSTLCAACVPKDKIAAVVEYINKLPGVTHNYLRENDFNLWFTLTVSRTGEIATIIESLKKDFAIKVVQMPSLKMYKIKVSFEIGE